MPPLLEEGGRIGSSMTRSLPCIPMGCSACCRETTMPLTKAEAALLTRRTGMAIENFTWRNNGILTLLNDEKTRACVFLLTASSDANAEGMCSVYEVRPQGCRTYPNVLNHHDEVILDEGCPHKAQFSEPTEEDAIVLLNLEEQLLREG
ncbi:MAG TPA: YkgJ family cysteine cluster protein [Candidatus Poseidoniaceae archaeon]|nr:YkgJ family cysteine cluster protein [Candidatus Poseidoniaceae archaeon]